MISLGLTGSIGMGKSTAAAMLKKMGCGVHDADQAAREALLPTGRAFEEVALTFPKVWNKKTHTLKRDVLADIIFKDARQKEILEDIVHPVVRQSQENFARQQQRLGRGVVVFDVPLLFETDSDRRFDYSVVVSAPYHIQRQRVLRRNGMTPEKFKAVNDSQMSDAQKRTLADFIIPTGLGMAYSYQCLMKMLKEIK